MFEFQACDFAGDLAVPADDNHAAAIAYGKGRGVFTQVSTGRLFQTTITPGKIPGIVPLASTYEEFKITKVEVTFIPQRHVSFNTSGQAAALGPTVSVKDKLNGAKMPGDDQVQHVNTSFTGATAPPMGLIPDPIHFRGADVIARPTTASGIQWDKPFKNAWHPKLQIVGGVPIQQALIAPGPMPYPTANDPFNLQVPVEKVQPWLSTGHIVYPTWDQTQTPTEIDQTHVASNPLNVGALLNMPGPIYSPNIKIGNFDYNDAATSVTGAHSQSFFEWPTGYHIKMYYKVYVKFRGFKPLTQSGFNFKNA